MTLSDEDFISIAKFLDEANVPIDNRMIWPPLTEEEKAAILAIYPWVGAYETGDDLSSPTLSCYEGVNYG